MLSGERDPASLAEGAPAMPALDTEPLGLAGASVLRVLCEIESSGLASLLPPALHPTLPPVVNWTVYRFPETPWGPTTLAQTRIQCRSGARPRALLVGGVVDRAEAADALARRWGYRLAVGEVTFRRSYDEVRARASVGAVLALELALKAPDRLDPASVQFVASVHPALTPRGLRLLQVDPAHAVSRAERGVPVVDAFEPTAFGELKISPVYPISAVFCVADVTLPRLRYLCRPDAMAFEGTEVL